jgi:hypothetical protein
MQREVERAVAFFLRRRARYHRRAGRAGERRTDQQSFRVTVDLRLRNLEEQLEEVKGRINGLLFLLAGAVGTQVILKLFG